MQEYPELTPEQFDLALRRFQILREAQEYKKQNKREFVGQDWWYPWQHEGFETQAQQWMTMAANQVGKTISEGYHFALDMTGQYPEWWRGYQFTHAPNCLALGVDAEQLRTVIQPELFGEIIEPPSGKKFFGGGWVHRNEIGRVEWSQVTNIARRVEILGKYGRTNCVLRTSTQSKTGSGSLSFAGARICRIWVDECPPDELVGQLNVRTANGNMGKGGRIGYTMTPELGATKLVTNFMDRRESSQHFIGPIGWDQAPHMDTEKQKTLLAGIPEHERDMRTKGIPFFGSGMVYTCPNDRIKCEPFQIHTVSWLRFIRAMDLGINHPTAIAWLAYDAEIDRIYVLRTYSQSGDAAAVHASACNSYLDFAPCVFPPDIDNREKGSGKTLRKYYAEAGLKNTLDFKNEDGTRFVEPGIVELDDRMRSDRLKVFDTCEDFFREKALYHRKDGQIDKTNDDVMDAVRYGAAMIRKHGVPLGGNRRRGGKPKVKSSLGKRRKLFG